MNSFSAKNRPELLKQLKEQTFDVLVIGGGITGAGIALDAAARGLKVALVEMQDFAGGTSSRSTRLIHGGLRYLKQGDFKLVSEVSKERAIIHRNASHLVKPELLLLPITKGGSFGKFTARLGMWIYELLAGIKKEERHRFLNTEDTLKMEPLMKKEGLLGSILYYEYRTDDARLTLSVLKEAVNRGALVLSYLKVTGFIKDGGKIRGVQVEDQLGKNSFNIKSTYVINASGPWVDDLDHLDDPKQGGKLQLTKGVHLVFDFKKLPLKQAVYFDTFDKRMIFVLPHRGKTYVGTTDTFFNGDKINPEVNDEDKKYLVKSINDYFSTPALELSDIESCWAGIRPLIKKAGKKPSEISRRDETFVSESGLISIAGGKLTGYRKMAQRVVDLVAKKIESSGNKKVPACSTESITLSGGKINGKFSAFRSEQIRIAKELELTEEETDALIHRYGSELNQVFSIIKEQKNVVNELPLLLRAELLYGIEHEMCLSPVDFFVRRTGMLYFEFDSLTRYKTEVTRYMQEILNWDNAEAERHGKLLQQMISATMLKA